jgi:predicted  nucleic acid-binding Zn-ribbon protein
VETFKDNLLTESEAPSRTGETLRAELLSVNCQLENLKKQWEDEKCQLIGEKAALRDTAERLDARVKRAQEEARRAVESGRARDKARASVEGVCIFSMTIFSAF